MLENVNRKVKVRKAPASVIRAERIAEIEDIARTLPLLRLNSLLWDAKMERNAQVLSDIADFALEKRHTPSKF